MNDKLDMNNFYQGLDRIFAEQRSSDAEEYFVKWLGQAEQNQDLAAITAVCNEMGGFYRAAGKIDQAKSLYKRVLDNLEAMGKGSTEDYAAALINTGSVYTAANENEKALELYERAAEILKNVGLTSDYRMAAVLNNISTIFRNLRKPDEAEQAIRGAFDIISKLPEHRAELATTYVNLAEVQVQQGKIEVAKENLLAAMKIYETELGGKDPHYAAANATLGEIYFHQKNYRESERYYREALRLIERDYGRTPSYDMVLKNLKMVEDARRNEA